MTELFADINNIKICYKVEGAGDPLILIHGFGSNKGRAPILNSFIF